MKLETLLQYIQSKTGLKDELWSEERNEIEHCISYACKEGFLDESVAEVMTGKEKEDYYNRCMAYEPPEE